MQNAGEGAEKLDHSYIAGGNVKWCLVTMETRRTVSYKTKHVSLIELRNCTLVHLSQRNKNLYPLNTWRQPKCPLISEC